jgi:hypothetical protein
MEGVEAEAFCGRLEDAKLAIGRKRGHGQVAPAWSLEWSSRIIAGDADLVFSLFVEGFEIVIRYGPVFERTAHGRAVDRTHAEILGHITPGLGSITEGSAAHASGVVVVCALAGRDQVRLAFLINPDPWIAFVIGAECISQDGGALITQVVFAAVIGGVPLAALEHHHAESRSGQLLGDDASSRARTDDDRIDALHDFDSEVKSYCARPRTGGSSSPSMRQLMASRLPPCRGDP